MAKPQVCQPEASTNPAQLTPQYPTTSAAVAFITGADELEKDNKDRR